MALLMIQYFMLAFVLIQMLAPALFKINLKIKPKLLNFLFSKTYCLKCLSFWLTLILSHNILIAAGASFIAIMWEEWYDFIKGKIQD